MSMYNLNGSYNILDNIKTEYTKWVYFRTYWTSKIVLCDIQKKAGKNTENFIVILEIIWIKFINGMKKLLEQKHCLSRIPHQNIIKILPFFIKLESKNK